MLDDRQLPCSFRLLFYKDEGGWWGPGSCHAPSPLPSTHPTYPPPPRPLLASIPIHIHVPDLTPTPTPSSHTHTLPLPLHPQPLGKYFAPLGSILPVGDVTASVPQELADVAILEEPEHVSHPYVIIMLSHAIIAGMATLDEPQHASHDYVIIMYSLLMWHPGGARACELSLCNHC